MMDAVAYLAAVGQRQKRSYFFPATLGYGQVVPHLAPKSVKT